MKKQIVKCEYRIAIKINKELEVKKGQGGIEKFNLVELEEHFKKSSEGKIMAAGGLHTIQIGSVRLMKFSHLRDQLGRLTLTNIIGKQNKTKKGKFPLMPIQWMRQI